MPTNNPANLFEIKTVWHESGNIYLLDQTLLPTREVLLQIADVSTMWEAIKTLRVRGAPAIGVAAGYGVWLAANAAASTGQDVKAAAIQACDYLATSRPTAVNLFWALDRMRQIVETIQFSGCDLADRLLLEAEVIRSEDLESGRAIGRYGADLISDGDNLLTHCNAGALATAGFGTALAPMFWAAQVQGKRIHVYADETRPLLQGARLTAWELQKAGIPVTLICDSVSGSLMAAGKVQRIIVGADRIAANGDFANKIGTYNVAVLAKHHGVPLYVAAPFSTIDATLSTGAEIPIEERHRDEVANWGTLQTAPDNVTIYNPAFDVTPAGMVTSYITDRGILETIPSALDLK